MTCLLRPFTVRALARPSGALVALLLVLAGLPPAQAASGAPELADLSIKELMNIEVTTASKRAQKLSETAAAVYVITNDDIRRSGARNVPEALRMAPGVDVAFIGGGRYAVTIRGSNGRFANKLLVLIDGRSIYTPLYSGVMWETQGPVLEDIDRIEIIRGPGASVWGANAVNGVINIITRNAKDTQGILVSGGAGTLDRGFATVQYGSHAFDGLTYRVYGKSEVRSESQTPDGQPGHDGSRDDRAGLRLDQELRQGHLSLQGEVYHGLSGDRITQPLLTAPYQTQHDLTQRQAGGDVLVRWDQTVSSRQDLSLQAYYDFAALTLPYVAGTQLKNIDLEFEHRLRLFERNRLTWGLGYRVSGDRVANTAAVQFDPTGDDLRIASAFMQDEFDLVPETLHLTLGGKLEHDSFSGSHFMPDARLLWDINPDNQAWLAVERAVRTPSFGERSSTVLINTVIPPGAMGNPLPVQPVSVPNNFGAEHLTAYELGYRTQLGARFSLDTTAYYNFYTNLRSGGTPLQPQLVLGLPPYILQPVPISNGLSGRELGVELAADWRVIDNWRLQASYSRSRISLDETDSDGGLDSTPRGILSLRSSATLFDTQFDLWLRHVGQRLATQSTPQTDAYTTMDAAFSWRLPHSLEVAVVGKDLLEKRHPEIVSNFVASEPLAVERSAYIRFTWTY